MVRGSDAQRIADTADIPWLPWNQRHGDARHPAGDDVVPIPGTKRRSKLEENVVTKAASIFGVFGVEVTAYDPGRLGNVKFLRDDHDVQYVDFYDVYIKK